MGFSTSGRPLGPKWAEFWPNPYYHILCPCGWWYTISFREFEIFGLSKLDTLLEIIILKCECTIAGFFMKNLGYLQSSIFYKMCFSGHRLIPLQGGAWRGVLCSGIVQLKVEFLLIFLFKSYTPSVNSKCQKVKA